MNNEQNNEQLPQQIDVLAEAESAKAKLYAMGANDYEFDAIEQIKQGWIEKKITAEEAIKKIQEILKRKQDNH